MTRAVAVAIPARDEEACLPGCLAALDVAAAVHGGPVDVVVFANGCRDGTVERLERVQLRHARLHWRAASLLPGMSHAGWARRLAFDAAAALLTCSDDLLLGTDADTLVAPDWIARTVVHVDRGAAAVAGRAFTPRAERAGLGAEAKRRLDLLGRYYTALDRVRAARAPDPGDPWPRHHYEGGASIALTLDWYRRIGGAPTPALGEDRALFAAVRDAGGRVRHPVDVRVFTSCRAIGRAPGGMADTVARWIAQAEDEALHETYAMEAALAPEAAVAAHQLSFRTLPAAIAEVQEAIRALRLAATPQVEPIPLVPLGQHDRHGVAQAGGERPYGLVAAQRIIGIADPVDQQEVAA
jgi:hypothetical protein